MNYEQTADVLVNRIVALGPQILKCDSAWDLFKIKGFKCDDIGPSLAQAEWALAFAQRHIRKAR